MVTLDDIKYATFRKSTIGGYRTDDVDTFIDDIQDSFQDLLDQNRELEKKLEKLSKQLEDYKEDEDAFKKAFLKAEKVSEASVKEAKFKAESIIEEAKIEAERIVKESEMKIQIANSQFDTLKSEISDFKKKIISIYKEHLKLLDSLPVSNAKKNTQVSNITKPKEDSTESNVKVNRNSSAEEKDDSEIKDVEDIDLDLDVKEIKSRPNRKNNHNRGNKPQKLKFGESYDISGDTDSDDESPLNLFDKF